MSLFTLDKPTLSIAIQDFMDDVDAKGQPPLYQQTPENARQTLLDAQTESPVEKPDADVADINLPVGPTGNINVRVVKPKGAKGRLPCVVYLHGGGWVMGGKETHDRLIRELAVQGGVAVVFPEYGLAPETQYPVPLEQCYAVLEHIARNSREMGFDGDGIVLAGDSAGGAMATVLSMLSRERGGPRVLLQVLFYPVTNHDFDTKSYREFSDGPWLTRKAMKWFWDKYLPDVSRRDERNASPLRARDDELEGLPPTLVITAENDVLRDEGEAYARRLDDAGVPTASVRMNGAIHDFVMLNALAGTPQTRMAIHLAVTEIKKAFQTTFPESR